MILNVNSDYFFGSLIIPNLQQPNDGMSGLLGKLKQTDLNKLIAKYEVIFLQKILGFTLYNEFLEGISQPIPLQKWVDLKDLLVNLETKTSPLANYVWWIWARQSLSETTDFGQKIAKSENSMAASPIPKMVFVWNEMVDLLNPVSSVLFTDDYNADIWEIDQDLYTKQNVFGL